MPTADRATLREALTSLLMVHDAYVVRERAEQVADAFIKGFLAEILAQAETAAQAVAERDEARAELEAQKLDVLLNEKPVFSRREIIAQRDAAQAEIARLSAEVEALKAERDENKEYHALSSRERNLFASQVVALTKERDEALGRAKAEKDSADMYANAWVRELGGKLFHKRFHIDACVKTTRWMRERSDRLAVIEAEQKAAALIAEYGPSNEMVAARTALAAGQDKTEGGHVG